MLRANHPAAQLDRAIASEQQSVTGLFIIAIEPAH